MGCFYLPCFKYVNDLRWVVSICLVAWSLFLGPYIIKPCISFVSFFIVLRPYFYMFVVLQGGSDIRILFYVCVLIIYISAISLTLIVQPLQQHYNDLVDTLSFDPDERWSLASLRSSNVQSKWELDDTRIVINSWYASYCLFWFV